MKNVCVFASSSNKIKKIYFEKTEELGAVLAKKGFNLIFGAGMTGLMGAAAKSMLANGAQITGVIPELLNVKNVVHEKCTKLIVTKTMHERKKIMEEQSDAFIALPGGFGTLEELLEIITLKQLRYHDKPVVIMNFNGYYDNLKSVFEKIIDERFAIRECHDLFFVTDDSNDAANYIENYKPFKISSKWLTDLE